MPDVTLGLDLGTSGVRVVAVDIEGRIVAESTRDYPLLTPKPGWTEQNPADWYGAGLEALRDVTEGLVGYEVRALGMSGQMHGMVPLDRHGKVLRPALLWNDQRTGKAVQEIESRVPREKLIKRGGNPAITGFQLPKLVWLRSEETQTFAKVRHVLFPKDYLSYRLTGEMVAEPSDASGSNCFLLAKKQWDEEVLKALHLDPAVFPRVVASDEVIGTLNMETALATGLPEGLPVIAGGGDNAAAGIGLGLSKENPGRGSVSLGTSGVIFLPLNDATPDPQGRVHLFCHADGGYHLLGVTLAAAGSFGWYRRTFAPHKSFDDLTALAGTSSPGANGVTFKPYLAGERTPHMNPDLRGSFTGLSLATNEADVGRAVLEGVAYSLRDALDVMLPLGKPTELLATGGGAASDLWLQMVADVLDVPLLKPSHNQGAAYGAALLAMQGVGMAGALEVANRALSTTDRIEPQGKEAYQEGLERYRGV